MEERAEQRFTNQQIYQQFPMNEDEELFESNQFLKNEYSTFIQELEDSTEKLIDEVFNQPYRPEPVTSYQPQQPQSFRNFLKRNKQFVNKKQTWIKREQTKQERKQIQQLKDVPDILRGSREQLQPIYQRYNALQREKERRIDSLRLEQKREQAETIAEQCPFQPEILNKGESRSLEEYLRDKDNWMRRKMEKGELLRLKKEAQKYTECTFTPQLVSKQINREPEPIEERLLRSLEGSLEKVSLKQPVKRAKEVIKMPKSKVSSHKQSMSTNPMMNSFHGFTEQTPFC